MMSKQAAGSLAIIVGASRGIGRGFVEYLAQKSSHTIIATFRSDQGHKTLESLAESLAEGRLHLKRLDATVQEDFTVLAEFAQTLGKDLVLAVNCIGLLHSKTIQPEKTLQQIQLAALQEYFAVNASVTPALAAALLPLFRKSTQKPSTFAAISAKVGSIGDNRLGGWYGYRASKAALNMFIKTIALEYSRKSPATQVLALHPGTTDTDLSKPFQKNVPEHKLFSVSYCVEQLMNVIETADEESHGRLLNWDGALLPW